MSSEFRSKQVLWHLVVVWASMGNTVQAETEGGKQSSNHGDLV